MNKQGEIGNAVIITIFIGVVIGLILLQGSAVGIGQSTTTQNMNRTFTAPAVNGTIDLQGQELITTPFVTWNHTCSNETATVGSGNYTIAEGISSVDGLKRIRLSVTDNAALSECGTIASKDWTISYTFGPEGYADNSGARSVIGLILIFTSLAIAVIVLKPTLEELGYI